MQSSTGALSAGLGIGLGSPLRYGFRGKRAISGARPCSIGTPGAGENCRLTREGCELLRIPRAGAIGGPSGADGEELERSR